MDERISSPDARTLRPTVRLFGPVDEAMLAKFLDALPDNHGGAPFVVELTTLGGDADVARRIALECELAQEDRECFFVGKTSVMSAGITIMAAFPVQRRYLDRHCELLIHERHMEKTVSISGPLKASLKSAEELIAQIKSGLRLEEEGFRKFIQDSRLSYDDLLKKVQTSWYVRGKDAVELGLAADLI